MKKPLSYKVYIKGNRWQIIRYITCISLCIILLGMTKVVLNAQQREIDQCMKQYDYFTLITEKNEKVIGRSLIEKIKALDPVDGIYPIEEESREFIVLFSSLDEETYRISREGAAKAIGCIDKVFKQSSLPDEDSGKRIISSRIFYNDRRADNEGKEEENSSIFQCDSPIAFMPSTIEEPAISYLIVAKEGRLEELNGHLKVMLPDNVILRDENYKNTCNQKGYENIEENFGILLMLVTLVASVTAGLLTYVHYIERRKEIGLLNLLGYSQKKLILRVTKEIMIDTLVALIMAAILLVLSVWGCNILINCPNSYQIFSLDRSVFYVMLTVPVFMMFFSMIPIWIMLRTTSEIMIVERGY